jgi:hypothetical protein
VKDFVKTLCETAVNLLAGCIGISSGSIRSLFQEAIGGRMNQKVELKDIGRNRVFW